VSAAGNPSRFRSLSVHAFVRVHIARVTPGVISNQIVNLMAGLSFFADILAQPYS
jgi:hypothetical protein